MAALATRADFARTKIVGADGEVAWSWCPDAGIKSSGDEPRDDGGKKARFPGEIAYKP